MNRSFLAKKAVVIPLALFCCLLWGSAFPCIKLGYGYSHITFDDTASQILYAGIRFTLAGIFAFLIGSIMLKKALTPSKKAFPKIVKLSLFQTILQYSFFYIGLARSTGIKSSVITASNVFLSILVASLIFKTEKLTLRKIVGCIIGFSGVLLINTGSIGKGFTVTGEGFVFLSALSYAFSAALIKRYSVSEEPVMLSAWQFIAGGSIMSIIGYISGGRLAALNTASILMIIYLAFVSAAAFSIWGTLLKHNPVSTVSVFGFMNPVFGVILSFFILSEKSNTGVFKVISALILVTAGIVTITLAQRKNNS